MSGTASVFLGGLALLGVVAFWFPGVFSSAAFRAHYPPPVVRALLEVTIALASLLGAVSLALRRRKVLDREHAVRHGRGSSRRSGPAAGPRGGPG